MRPAAPRCGTPPPQQPQPAPAPAPRRSSRTPPPQQPQPAPAPAPRRSSRTPPPQQPQPAPAPRRSSRTPPPQQPQPAPAPQRSSRTPPPQQPQPAPAPRRSSRTPPPQQPQPAPGPQRSSRTPRVPAAAASIAAASSARRRAPPRRRRGEADGSVGASPGISAAGSAIAAAASSTCSTSAIGASGGSRIAIERVDRCVYPRGRRVLRVVEPVVRDAERRRGFDLDAALVRVRFDGSRQERHQRLHRGIDAGDGFFDDLPGLLVGACGPVELERRLVGRGRLVDLALVGFVDDLRDQREQRVDRRVDTSRELVGLNLGAGCDRGLGLRLRETFDRRGLRGLCNSLGSGDRSFIDNDGFDNRRLGLDRPTVSVTTAGSATGSGPAIGASSTTTASTTGDWVSTDATVSVTTASSATARVPRSELHRQRRLRQPATGSRPTRPSP